MRLITGPAGFGKTASVLEQFRAALRKQSAAIRLLVPTATMAQHLQNRLVREGFLLRPESIQTLSAFIANWASDLPQVSESALYLIVEQAVRWARRPEFARVEQMPGFCALVARTVAEFASAGCGPARLAGNLPEAPLAAAFLTVYQEVDRELARRGLAMRGTRFERAAERIAAEGTKGIQTIWLDGFHELPDPELRVIEALGRHAEVTLTFEAMDERLSSLGFEDERRARVRPAPVLALVRAPTIEREADEIARRILEQAAAGRPFREMAIIVRAKETYVPILRTTLERFGIPARFYFDEKLDEHPVARFLSGAVDAMLSGWDHTRTLAVLRLAPRYADSPDMDRFDFAVREQIPESGLGALKALAELHAHELIPLIDALGGLEEWCSFVLRPKDWAQRLQGLRALFRPAAQEGPVAVLRSQAAALASFSESLDEAAEALDPTRQLPLQEFWRAAQAVLRLKPLRVPDERRNVVHVLSAPEARQWVLPVVFVCGMVEKQFPQFHPQDPFVPDRARCNLNSAGIRARTAAEFEREERALFDSAISRATLLTTLSYPEFDARGESNLPSIYLEDLLLAPDESRPVRPKPRRSPLPRVPARIEAPGLLEYLRGKTEKVSPTTLETFLQCPFQYFGTRALRLKPAPPRPEKRLDFLTQGNIVHRVLAEWWADRKDLERRFETIFAQECEEKKIPRGYHTERIRYAMLEDLQAFAGADHWPCREFRSLVEQEFTFPLNGFEIVGKIDRLDIAADGSSIVIDYKYSAPDRTKARPADPNLLQAPLYMMAAEHCFGAKATGMYYVGVKAEIVYAGWSESEIGALHAVPLPENWFENAEQRTLRIVQEIRAGRIEPAPADLDKCRFCDCRDVCRISIRQPAALGEGA